MDIYIIRINMNNFIPGHVYENLIKLLAYRSVKITSPILSIEDVISKLNHSEIVNITGTRDPSDQRGGANVNVILIAPGSKYATKSSDFRKLLTSAEKLEGTQTMRVELLIVSEEDLTVHIKKHLLPQYKEDNPSIYIEDYNYSLFKIETPKHKLVPEHIILSDAEVKDFCDLHYTSKDKFPKILQTDAMAVWLGLRPGMVVMINCLSETAGEVIKYRLCIKN